MCSDECGESWLRLESASLSRKDTERSNSLPIAESHNLTLFLETRDEVGVEVDGIGWMGGLASASE